MSDGKDRKLKKITILFSEELYPKSFVANSIINIE